MRRSGAPSKWWCAMPTCADIAAYVEQICGMQGSVEDREEGLRQLTDQFLPNRVVEIAHRTYREIRR